MYFVLQICSIFFLVRAISNLFELFCNILSCFHNQSQQSCHRNKLSFCRVSTSIAQTLTNNRPPIDHGDCLTIFVCSLLTLSCVPFAYICDICVLVNTTHFFTFSWFVLMIAQNSVCVTSFSQFIFSFIPITNLHLLFTITATVRK